MPPITFPILKWITSSVSSSSLLTRRSFRLRFAAGKPLRGSEIPKKLGCQMLKIGVGLVSRGFRVCIRNAKVVFHEKNQDKVVAGWVKGTIWNNLLVLASFSELKIC